jgi:hypothetical protein
MTTEARPHSAARGYDRAWRKRQAAHLERVRIRQEAEGFPGGPWCECEVCMKAGIGPEVFTGVQRANTVDHYPRPRRAFPLELQGSEEIGGSDHPSNLRAMSHSHHSRRTEDKARKRRI